MLWLVGISNAVITVVLFCLVIYKWHAPLHSIPFSMTLCALGLIILGVIASFTAESSLRNGVEAKSWSDRQLVLTSRLASHPAVWGWIGLLFAFMVVYGIFSRDPTFGVLALPTGLNLIRVSTILRKAQKNEGDPSSLHLAG